MRTTLLAVVALAMTVTTVTATAAEFAGNVAFASDYRFRGISQGDRSPAIQGGFDIAAENGVYFGAWASNVTFSGASIEMDYYVGWGGEINENTAVDVGTRGGVIVIGNNLVGDTTNRVFIGNGTNHIHADFNSSATWSYSSDAHLKNI